MRPVTRLIASGLGMRLPRSAYSAILRLPYMYTVFYGYLHGSRGMERGGYRTTPGWSCQRAGTRTFYRASSWLWLGGTSFAETASAVQEDVSGSSFVVGGAAARSSRVNPRACIWRYSVARCTPKRRAALVRFPAARRYACARRSG